MASWATCYVDASYSRKTGACWSAWRRSSAGRIIRSGACPSGIRDSVGAELAAIYAGVFLAVARLGARGVLVRSDCRPALGLAAPDARRARRREHARLQARLRALVAEHDVDVDLQWTPPHRPRNEGTRAILNAACDRLASRHTKQARHR